LFDLHSLRTGAAKEQASAIYTLYVTADGRLIEPRTASYGYITIS